MNLKELAELATIGGQKLLERRIEDILAAEGMMFLSAEEAVLRAPEQRLAAFQQGFGKNMKRYILSMSTPERITLAAIFLLLLIDFKNLKLTLLALSPLVLGAVAMLGIMGALRHPFNIMSIIVLPLLIGIGVDNGVHILHRYRIEGDEFPLILSSVGKALFMTTFTTMVAFGSLMFARWRAFVGMGLLLFVGIGSIYLVTITFVPSLPRLATTKSRYIAGAEILIPEARKKEERRK